MFKEFKDVKARDEVKQEESVLEKLITLGDELINNPEMERIIFDNDKYDYIENKLKSLDFTYDEKDIVSLIRSCNYLEDDNSKGLFGVYTGCLLTKLTESRHAEGKTTNIVIDGLKLDYILFGTKKADSILINNCEGDKIGVYIGSDKGHIGQVIINNCNGEILGSNIGYIEGSINQVIINNCKGYQIGELIGLGGNVNQVIINNCEGDWIGRNIGSFLGKVNQVIINNCKGGSWGGFIGSNGSNVKQVIINNCEGDSTRLGIGYNGNVEQLIINDPKAIQEQNLTGLIELVDSLTGKSYQEVQEIARKIGEYSNV